MPRYKVGIKEVHYNMVIVEAENEVEARAKADDESDELDSLRLMYSHTEHEGEWTVEELS